METEERLVAYQIAVQDIRDLKANQWRFSHYGLLSQTGLVAASTVLKTPGWLPFDAPWGLVGLSVATCWVIVLLIHEAQGQIVQLRPATDSLEVQRDETMAEWTEEFGAKRLNWLCRPREHWRFWERDRLFGILFAFVQTVAMVLAIGIIWSGESLSAC